jgi:hypothetical protein
VDELRREVASPVAAELVFRAGVPTAERARELVERTRARIWSAAG